MNLLKRIPDRPAANWLIMLVMATAIMMLLSRDSYLYLLGPRCDSAWFFMCGKAWMNGMVPYVDFADSKGPLLWLIYGVGYLLSHYDYHGVFWVSVVVYSFTFYFLFKTARIFVEHRSQAILAVLMTSVAIFSPITHYDTQAEDFCMFFTALSLWQLCRMLYAEHTEHDERTAFFAFGISLAGTLLIKYNITAMCCIFPAIGLYYLLREHHPVWRPLLACAAGFAALALPFLIYFLIQGNFSAFIQEYFTNTLQSMSNRFPGVSPFKLMYFVAANLIIGNTHILIIVLLVFVGSGIITKGEKYGVMLIIIELVFLLMVFRSGYFQYYYSSLMGFSIFFNCVLISKLLKSNHYKYVLCGLTITSLAIISFETKTLTSLKYTSFDDEIKTVMYEIEEVLAKKGINPLIISASRDAGHGIMSNALPACKYWSLQVGANKMMIDERMRCIKQKRCDFFIIDEYCKEQNQYIELMDKYDYSLVYSSKIGEIGQIHIFQP